MVIDAWSSGVAKMKTILSSLSDEDFENSIGNDKVNYIIAHLTAINDLTIEVLGIGEINNMNLYNYFKVYETKLPLPISNKELLKLWTITCEQIDLKIKDFTPDDWFGKHTAVTIKEFNKEPDRNKLNVLLNRSHRMATAVGQLSLFNKSKS